MKVNMTLNPLDVVTIHASQGDSEARQWEFELHNNGELIDTSDVKEQLVFKAYKGGTEQLLPENGSTPTTSPFLGDIRYPQGLLTDQEFTYRQSPTEEDGLAKITDIKGNTLVWNQLVQNGNFADESGWSFGSRTTHTVSNNECVMTAETVGNADQWTRRNIGNIYSSHKYLFLADLKGDTEFRLQIIQMSPFAVIVNRTASISSSYQRIQFIFAPTANGTGCYAYYNFDSRSNLSIKNAQIIDLTQMGLDITSPSDFTSLFSLPYYSYKQGTLLSFMGNGIKTTGMNQFNSEHAISATSVVESNDNGTITIKDVSSATWSNTYIGYSDVITGKEYTFKASLKYGRIGGNLSGASRPASANQPDTNIGDLIFVTVTSAIPSRTFIPNFTGRIYWWYCTDIQNANHQRFTMQPMLSTTDADFEPYTSSTLSLPISTYFPTGMKSAGTVYDELTPRKAITRIGAVDLGTLDWRVSNGTMYANLSDAYLPSTGATVANAICPKYTTASLSYVIAKSQDKILALNNGQPRVNIYDSAYTDAVAFKTAMDGVILYYELATPTETSFTTASLVTENGEVSLANENGVLIGKCNSDVSADAGFIEGKIKLSDENGDVYSNKIQIHVERSPQ